MPGSRPTSSLVEVVMPLVVRSRQKHLCGRVNRPTKTMASGSNPAAPSVGLDPLGLDILEHERLEFAQLPAPLSPETGRSLFETLARLSAQPAPQAEQLLDILLAAAPPNRNPGPAVLRPIWAEEAMHRTCAMARMLTPPVHRPREAAARYDLAVAQHLADLFRSLDEPSARQHVPCSHLLREIVVDLVALCGTGAGSAEIALATHIERLYLPSFKRRALILAAVELVMNALLHAFTGRAQGRIDVSLTMLGPARARLEVKDDGVGFLCGQPNFGRGIAAGLADLLEAELAYFRNRTMTAAEIVFPVRPG